MSAPPSSSDYDFQALSLDDFEAFINKGQTALGDRSGVFVGQDAHENFFQTSGSAVVFAARDGHNNELYTQQNGGRVMARRSGFNNVVKDLEYAPLEAPNVAARRGLNRSAETQQQPEAKRPANSPTNSAGPRAQSINSSSTSNDTSPVLPQSPPPKYSSQTRPAKLFNSSYGRRGSVEVRSDAVKKCSDVGRREADKDNHTFDLWQPARTSDDILRRTETLKSENRLPEDVSSLASEAHAVTFAAIVAVERSRIDLTDGKNLKKREVYDLIPILNSISDLVDNIVTSPWKMNLPWSNRYAPSKAPHYRLQLASWLKQFLVCGMAITALTLTLRTHQPVR